MADYSEATHQQQQQQQNAAALDMAKLETAVQALNNIIQLHFEKTLEKKRAVDLQKKELWKLFQVFFLFLGLVFLGQAQSSSRLQCRHCWIPIGLLSLAHLIFYVSVAQTLRCINGFKYQRRCHKLTLALATDRLRHIKKNYYTNNNNNNNNIRPPNPNHNPNHNHNHAHAHAADQIFQEEEEEEDLDHSNNYSFQIHYQEPPDSYFAKLKRNWALHFGFLIFVYAFSLCSSVVLLCF